MAAADYNIILEEGQAFILDITWYKPDDTPVDITGYGAEMVVKKEKDRNAPEVFKVDDTDYIVVGTTDGLFQVTILPVVIINFPDGMLYWQFNAITPTDTPIRIAQGRAKVDRGLF